MKAPFTSWFTAISIPSQPHMKISEFHHSLFPLKLSWLWKTLTLQSPQTSSVKMWDTSDLLTGGHIWRREAEAVGWGGWSALWMQHSGDISSCAQEGFERQCHMKINRTNSSVYMTLLLQLLRQCLPSDSLSLLVDIPAHRWALYLQ